MKSIKTFVKILVLIFIIISTVGCGSVNDEVKVSGSTTKSMTRENLTIYYNSIDNTGTIPVYFKNGNRQIPYLDMETVCGLLNTHSELGDDYHVALTTEEGTATLTRENGYSLVIDFDKDTFTYADYDKFMGNSNSTTVMDILTTDGLDNNGNPYLYKRIPEHSYDRYGHEFKLDFYKYDIDLVNKDGNYYLPLQVVSDMFFAPQYMFLLYNTEEIFIIYHGGAVAYRNGGSSALLDRYYSVKPEGRNDSLTEFSYNELCLVLDNFYGLKELHEIDSFNEYFSQIDVNGYNMKTMLCSKNSLDSDTALVQLVRRDLDDLHSSYTLSSVYTGSDQSFTESISYGFSNTNYNNTEEKFKAVRNACFPDGVPGYEEYGNTAYITFDSFSDPEINSLYSQGPTSEKSDSVNLIIYAHSRITRENSPIENVVVDLSLNSGGSSDAAILLCAWFLGEAQIYVKNPITGASSCNAYRCDVNLDRVFDERDCISDLNLYCLTSPVSFSCSNLVAAAFDVSNQVTLIGEKTSGGSCCILPLSTASGSMFRISGNQRISVIKNGAFYDIDGGISPDISLTKIESYYDRQELTDYINSLK